MALRSTQPRVHVLGLGSIGTFTAHCMSEVPAPLTPSITLLLHRPPLVNQFRCKGGQITLHTRENKRVCHSNYNLEVLQSNHWHGVSRDATLNQAPQESIIDNLIVCVKGAQTVSALRPLKHRLGANSNILFLQNGSGMVEEVNEQLFTDLDTRPNYIAGVISHGVTLNSPFDITHTGASAVSLGPIPRHLPSTTNRSITPSPSSSYLLEALPLVPRFNATSYTFLEVFQIQLEKLAVNAFSNPLGALNDSNNEFLLTIADTRRALLAEISRVIYALPELADVPGILERFSADRLDATVSGIIERNAETTCSMVFDLRRGQKTEILFINGYWSRRGREVGVPTPINDSLVRQVLYASN